MRHRLAARRALRAAVVMLSLATGACARAGRPAAVAAMSGEAAAIRAARLEQNALLARGDIDGAAAFWTDDVTARAGMGRAVTGRAAYAAVFRGDSVISRMRYVRTPVEIVVSAQWPLAYESGEWTGRRADAASDTPLVRGRYSAHWIKADGRWRIRSEVFVALECAGAACDWQVAPP